MARRYRHKGEEYPEPWLLREIGGEPVWFVLVILAVIVVVVGMFVVLS